MRRRFSWAAGELCRWRRHRANRAVLRRAGWHGYVNACEDTAAR